MKNYQLAFFISFLFIYHSSYSQDTTSLISLQKQASYQKGDFFELIYLNNIYKDQIILSYPNGKKFHISSPSNYELQLGPNNQNIIVFDKNSQEFFPCSELDSSTPLELLIKKYKSNPYISICQNKAFIQNLTNGHQSTVEWGSQFLRSNFGDSGEWIVDAVKSIRSEPGDEAETTIDKSNHSSQLINLIRPPIKEKFQNLRFKAIELDFDLLNGDKKALSPGTWYELKNHPDFYASIITGESIDKSSLQEFPDRVAPLDGIENNRLVYLVAWSADAFDMRWQHGTAHPGVEWSPRAVNINKLNSKGPDGFDNLSPYVTSGSVRPDLTSKTLATFSGGFQRRHSAFLYGDLSTKNKAHHYGFIENGVVLSSLQPDLSTLYQNQDGHIDLITWPSEPIETSNLYWARQNGVPLIEGGDESSQGIPGRYVRHWGPGNWSGSVDKELRTPRAGLCLVKTPSHRYFIYAYFSGGTPSLMALTFQAYGCDHAIHLDMNSAGQAYFSLFRRNNDGNKFHIEHLVKQMDSVNPKINGIVTPRYLLKPDYRDFFFIMKKDN